MNPDTSDVNLHMFLDHMAHPDGNYDTLYFMNHYLKTYDGGNTWDTIYTNMPNDRFIKVNATDHNQLIIGGETLALSAYLEVSPDRGLNWNYPTMTNYFAGDNSVHDIAFIGNDWYAAGEGVICKSTDGGNTWIQLINNWSGSPQFSLYFWDIEYSQQENYLYITGSNTLAVNVPLMLSGDHGINWDTLSFQPVVPGNPEMHALALLSLPFDDRIFIGGHGVYTYDNVFNGIDEGVSKKKFSIYPNPFQSTFTLNIDFP
jgi:hypothetical protein